MREEEVWLMGTNLCSMNWDGREEASWQGKSKEAVSRYGGGQESGR